MAYMFYNELWESEFETIVSKRDKVQDMKINRLKLEVHDTDEKDETSFEPSNNENVMNKSYLDGKILKQTGRLSLLKKDYNEFKLQYNKQSVEGILFQRAVKTALPILYDKGLIDVFFQLQIRF